MAFHLEEGCGEVPFVIRGEGEKSNGQKFFEELSFGRYSHIKTIWRAIPRNVHESVREYASALVDASFGEVFAWLQANKEAKRREEERMRELYKDRWPTTVLSE